MPDRSADIGAPDATRRRVLWVVAPVVVLGLAVTAILAWTAHVIDRDTERTLLQHQTRQAAAVIESAITQNVNPLQTALGIANATQGSPSGFTDWMRTVVGSAPPARFVDVSLWDVSGPPRQLASIGVPTGQSAGAVGRFAAGAPGVPTFRIAPLTTPTGQRIAYAVGSKGGRYAVYAERAIPANRRVPAESNPAFVGVHFATYIGTRESFAALQTTDRANSDLPLTGVVARERIDFGDRMLTLVTTPSGHLGGSLNADLPWLLIVGGVVLTALSALVAGQLVSGRATAESDARTISRLYEQLDDNYREMRTNVELLQRALLPRFDPDIPGLEVASRYVAGARGVDIGGDWYTVVPIDADRFAFAVGDVSGHGVEAAALMGRLRFTLRAYLLEGHAPEVALSMTSRDLDLRVDGHMATALVGLGSIRDRTVTLASAGHLAPLVVADGTREFLAVPTGRPLGIAPTQYVASTHVVPPGAAFLAFTDGLVERRGELIDDGMQRLADAVHGGRALSSELDDVLRTVTPSGSEDDIAILALRWTT
ncbi:MAG: PP2C family protein-serine/threonine phosphatase [Jatrophihabitans sp.]|uniref:PP2C family protein-serine/threonine phosphatase n=1 Tax=Jatrophihabitans sp. TaxID=1932789 RepID=UPI003F7CD3F3